MRCRPPSRSCWHGGCGGAPRRPRGAPFPPGRVTSRRRCPTPRSGCGSWSSSRRAPRSSPSRSGCGCAARWTWRPSPPRSTPWWQAMTRCACATRRPGTAQPQVVVAADGTLPLIRRDAHDEAAAGRDREEFLAEPFDLATGPLAAGAAGPPGRRRSRAGHRGAPHRRRRLVRRRSCCARSSAATRATRRRAAARSSTATTPPGSAPCRRRGATWTSGVTGWPGRAAGPADRPAPAAGTHLHRRGPSLRRSSPEVSAELARLGREHGATPYMTMLAAFAALLGRYAGTPDFAVGSPVAGRQAPELDGRDRLLREHARHAGRPVAATPPSPSCCERVRERRRGRLRPPGPAVRAARRRAGPAPRRVQVAAVPGVILAMQNYRDAAIDPPAGLSVADFPLDAWATRYDLELYVTDGPDGGLVRPLRLQHRPVRRGHRRAAGRPPERAAGAGGRPARPAAVRSSTCSPATSARLVVEDWNDTAAVFPGPATLHGPIAGAGRPHARGDRRALRRAVTSPTASWTRPRTGSRARCAAAGSAPGRSSPSAPSARWSCCRRAARRAQGRRRVPAARPRLPGRPARVHARRTPRRAALLTQARSGRRCRPPPRSSSTWTTRAVWTGAAGTRCPDGRGRTTSPTSSTPPAPPDGPRACRTRTRGIANRLDWMQERYRARRRRRGAAEDPAELRRVGVGAVLAAARPAPGSSWPRPAATRTPAYLRDLIVAEGVTTAHFVPSMLAVFLAEDGVGRLRLAAPGVCSRRGTARRPGPPLRRRAARAPSCTTCTARPRRPSTCRPGTAARRRSPGGPRADRRARSPTPRLYVLDAADAAGADRRARRAVHRRRRPGPRAT